MTEIPEFVKRIWKKEGPICDCCGIKIPIEQMDDIKYWYDPELHSIVCSCVDCQNEKRKPRGSGN